MAVVSEVVGAELRRRLEMTRGIHAVLHVSRLDLHSDWQGIEIKANERSNFVTYSDRRALYEVAEEMSGLNFGSRGAQGPGRSARQP